MATVQGLKQKVESAYELLSEDSTTINKFETVRTLLKGINPKVDEILAACSKTISDVRKLQQADVIWFTEKALPEKTDEQKKRKKALLLLINSYKQLKSEVEFLKKEFETSFDKQESSYTQLNSSQIKSLGKIAMHTWGPLAVVTIAAIIIAFVTVFVNKKTQNQQTANPPISAPENSPGPKTQVIIVNNQKIPLSEVRTVKGSECNEALHYHALENARAKTIDGTEISEPNPQGCGFGKVSDVPVVEF